MTVVWFIVASLAIVFVVALCGSAFRVLLQALLSAALIVATPLREIVRLCKSNQKKKALSLAASIAFAFASVLLLSWSLSL